MMLFCQGLRPYEVPERGKGVGGISKHFLFCFGGGIAKVPIFFVVDPSLRALSGYVEVRSATKSSHQSQERTIGQLLIIIIIFPLQ